jgi:hypothetical protein
MKKIFDHEGNVPHGATHKRDGDQFYRVTNKVQFFDYGMWNDVINCHDVDDWLKELEPMASESVAEQSILNIYVIARSGDICQSIFRFYDDAVRASKKGYWHTDINSHRLHPDNIQYFVKDDVLARSNIILVECFDGRVIVGSPYDLGSPKFLEYTVDFPAFSGESTDYLTENSVTFSIDENSAQLKSTVDHMGFVAAQRHFMKSIGLDRLIQ